MKKKNLIILLLIPFLIALLGVVTINTTFSIIDNDIIRIDWDYLDTEAFEVRPSSYLLTARGISEKDYPAGPGNMLVWSVKNKNANDEEVHAIVENKNNSYYLTAITPGEVIVTCANEKGNISKSFTALIYEGGYIIIRPKVLSSQNNIDQNIYFGEYDLKDGAKVPATFAFTIDTNRESILDNLVVKNSTSANLLVDLNNLTVTLKDGTTGVHSFCIGTTSDDIALPYTYTLNIVKDGVNVYTYDDLLNCTNRSEEGEIVVLRKSFESLNHYESLKSQNNVELFGTYNDGKFNFNNEVYRFKTTLCSDYIDQWNNFAKKDPTNYQAIENEVIAGLHVQKDFYGNGYTINMHNLTYPSSVIETVGDDGSVVRVPSLATSDLFRGPLPLYTLGDHSSLPLVEALGQDNIGMYVDGDNITINDVDVKNCEDTNMLSNLHYTGTVLETYGDNITIKNSRFANGKNIIRSYSSMDMILDNCMLSNARNFLLSVGTNNFIRINDNDECNFINLDGTNVTSTISDFLQIEAAGDNILNAYVTGQFEDKVAMKKSLLSVQDALNKGELIEGKFYSTIKVIDTLFYQSGIASISIDSMFNGPFLYGGVPSMIKQLLEMLVPFVPDRIGGLSYPVKVDIIGTTKFYDYKTKDQMDITGLINENISTFAQEAGDIFGVGYDGKITIDTIFPLKSFLMSKAPMYSVNDESYINIPIAFYGGAINKSVVNIDTLDMKAKLTNEISIDLLDQYLNLATGDTLSMIRNAMLKSVTIVTGYEPFKFICMDGTGYLYGEAPQVSELIENAKGK